MRQCANVLIIFVGLRKFSELPSSTWCENPLEGIARNSLYAKHNSPQSKFAYLSKNLYFCK